MVIVEMAIFRKIAKIKYRTNPKKSGNSLKLSFLWFSIKNDNLGLKMKVLKLSKTLSEVFYLCEGVEVHLLDRF